MAIHQFIEEIGYWFTSGWHLLVNGQFEYLSLGQILFSLGVVTMLLIRLLTGIGYESTRRIDVKRQQFRISRDAVRQRAKKRF